MSTIGKRRPPFGPLGICLAILLSWSLAGIVPAPAWAQEEAGSNSDPELESLLDESPNLNPAEQFEKSHPEIRTAAQKFAARDFAGAEETLKMASEKYPELPPAGIMLGRWYAQLKNVRATRAAYEKAARDDPDDPEAYIAFGENALAEGRFTDAALLFDHAVSIAEQYADNPNRQRVMMIRALSGAGRVAEAREDWEAAEANLRKLLEMDSQNINAMSRLGVAIFKKGDEQAAYKQFQDVHKVDAAKVARPEINMARLYQQDEKEANAAKLVKLAVERAPDSLATQLQAAQWALESGDEELLAQCAEAAVRIDNKSLQSRLLQGIVARLRGDSEGAEEAFQRALEISPSNVTALNQMALALVDQPNEAKRRRALEVSTMSTRIYADPSQAAGREAGVARAWVLHSLGQSVAAERQLQTALTSGRVGPEAAYYAAQILHDRGKSDAAAALLAGALQDDNRVFPNRDRAEQLQATVGSAGGLGSGSGSGTE